MKTSTHVLIASPVQQKPRVLQEFLLSLTELDISSSIKVEYLFIDDNTEQVSSQLLKEFHQQHSKTTIIDHKKDSGYFQDGFTHYWNEQSIKKVAAMKDYILQIALEKKVDFLFLVDSDLVLHPSTLRHLLRAEKEIISNIFWTKWQPNTIEMPQVWLEDKYTLYKREDGENLTDDEISMRTLQFLALLRIPGIYEVGGLGACTLISSKAIQKGVSFEKLHNVSFWGEDRHFCIRAVALGFSLFVDTHYPAYHIYRDADLAGVATFKEKCREVKS